MLCGSHFRMQQLAGLKEKYKANFLLDPQSITTTSGSMN